MDRRPRRAARRVAGMVDASHVSFAGLVAMEPRLLFSGDPIVVLSDPPEITLEGLGVEIIDGDDSPADTDGTALGPVVAQSVATRQFTVRNTGAGTLSITGLTLPNGFSLVEGLSSSLAAGESDSFTVQLNTSTLGVKSGQITILSDDADEGSFDFTISGVVIQTAGPEISLVAAGASIAIQNGDWSPDLADLTDFGDVFVGSSTYRNFVIHNLGDKTLTVSNLTVPPWVVLTSAAPGSIAPGASAQFTIRVDTSQGTLQASEITFSTNDADEGSFSFAIGARVIPQPRPELTIRGLEHTAFGDVPQGRDINVVRQFTIQNMGFVPLQLSDLTVTPGFIIEEGLSGVPVDRGNHPIETFIIRVDNSVTGALSGFVSFKTNDPLWGDITFPISANVTPPPASHVEVYGKDLPIENNDDTPRFEDNTDFGSMNRGGGHYGNRTKTFTIRNNSDTVLNLSNYAVTEGFTFFDSMPASLGAFQSHTFRIAMDVSAPGLRDAIVSFQTDDPNASTFSFRVSGVVTPEYEAEMYILGNGHIIGNGDTSPSAADLTDFGTVAQGSVAHLYPFVVRSVGSQGAQLLDLTVPEGFEIVNGMHAALSGGWDHDSFVIRMLTGTPGVKSGNVTFIIYDIVAGEGIETTYTFAIHGEVIGSAAGSNDQVVSISTIESAAYEATLSPGIVRVSRTGPVNKALTVGITRSGNATFSTGPTGDYSLSVDGFNITNRVTIPVGASFVDVHVTPLNDGKPDPFESVTIKLGGGSGYFLAADPSERTATVAIEDDSPVISIVAEPPPVSQVFAGAKMKAAFSASSQPESDSFAAETNAGDAADHASFRIYRRGNVSGAIDVNLSVSGTARRGTDYVLMIDGVVTTAKVVTIPAGESYVDLVIVPINDALVEKTETVRISVVASSKVYSLDPDKADRAATITIADNEATVAVEAIDAEASEPGESQDPGAFRIHRTGTTGEALTVAFTLSGGARRGSDYVNVGGKATIPAGASFVDVDIQPISDARTEADELATLKLTASRAYNIDAEASRSTVTIADAAQLAGVDLLAVAMSHTAKTFKIAGGNSALKVTTTILNQGSALSAPGAQVRVLLSADRTINAGDIELGTMSAALPATGARPVTLSGLFNIDGLGLGGSAVGSYYVLLIVDSADVVEEVFEDNNTFASLWSNVTITA